MLTGGSESISLRPSNKICVAAGSGPEELSARIKSDYELWAKVIRTAGVKLE